MDRLRFGLAGLGGPRTERLLYGPPGGDRLQKYGSQFEVYEMGCTRYDHWTVDAAEAILERMPPHVDLLPRLSRGIVHSGSIQGQEEELGRWLRSVRPLLRSPRCGPILIPWEGEWSPESQENLEGVLSTLWGHIPATGRISVEFRHPTWYRSAPVQMLEEYGASLVWSTLAGRVPYRTTADFIHVRITGAPTRRVSDEVQALWKQIKSRPNDDRPVYVVSARHHDPLGLRMLERFAGLTGHYFSFNENSVTVRHAVQSPLNAGFNHA
jgi:uncharacterized protein YecE (DUF72 family)